MNAELDSAFELLTRFNEGKTRTGNRVTSRQLKLVRLLAEDLLPRTKLPAKLDRDVFAKTLSEVREQNSRWNKKLMQAMVLSDDALKAGRRKEGLAYLDAFIKECPSDWYREHARAAKKNL